MTERKLHPWPHDAVADDFNQAMSTADTRMIRLGDPQRVPAVTPYEVEEVVRWHVTYNEGGKWEPGMETGTELGLFAVLRLRSGLWASVVAWNDYTGWGCQNGSDVRLGANEDEVVRQGLDAHGRRVLGYEVPSL